MDWTWERYKMVRTDWWRDVSVGEIECGIEYQRVAGCQWPELLMPEQRPSL